MRLDGNIVQELIGSFLEEDIGRGDITTDAVIQPNIKAKGRFLAKQELVLAGIEIVECVFQWLHFDLQLEAFYFDGDNIAAGTEIARIIGPAHVLLAGERVALNLLQRMCGIATLTDKYVRAIEGTDAKITDTRKTAPGLRFFDKYAVKIGGGFNHRFGLDDGLLIKDNHIALAGDITSAVNRARRAGSHLMKIEVEVSSMAQVEEALLSNVDIILLDNMTVENVQKAVHYIRENKTQEKHTLIEASGSINLNNVREYAEAGVDLISIGALTHSPNASDISLKITFT